MIEPDKNFWDNRWESNQIGWDIGYASNPIVEYIDQLEDKSIKILIPGCGNAYEAQYLFEAGFKNTWVIDISSHAIDSFTDRFRNFPKDQALHGDFFDHNGTYDLILEQTFFCALNPKLRESYIIKMNQLLKPKGKLVGLLFNDSMFANHPPYGGSKEDYLPIFEKQFKIKTFETCFNSIPQREGRELFINVIKR